MQLKFDGLFVIVLLQTLFAQLVGPSKLTSLPVKFVAAFFMMLPGIRSAPSRAGWINTLQLSYVRSRISPTALPMLLGL